MVVLTTFFLIELSFHLKEKFGELNVPKLEVTGGAEAGHSLEALQSARYRKPSVEENLDHNCLHLVYLYMCANHSWFMVGPRI